MQADLDVSALQLFSTATALMAMLHKESAEVKSHLLPANSEPVKPQILDTGSQAHWSAPARAAQLVGSVKAAQTTLPLISLA